MKRLLFVTAAVLSLTATPALAYEKTPIQGTAATTTTVDPALVSVRQALIQRALCLKYGC